MAGKDLKRPLGPIKPSRPGLHIATKTTEPQAPSLVPRWGAASSTLSSSVAKKAAAPRPATSVANAGLASERARFRMVERLMQQGIQNPKVIHAMRQVPRHGFVDEALASRAYEDTALPIGHQQTISQPYVVARVIELALGLLPADMGPLKALEIGGGCGYQAAVMSYCFDRVISVERIKVLADLGRLNLRPLRRSNLRFVYGDGLEVATSEGPFQVILISAGMADAPRELLGQLAPGGVMVAPLGEPEQRLTAIQRVNEEEFRSQVFDHVRYVPVLRGKE